MADSAKLCDGSPPPPPSLDASPRQQKPPSERPLLVRLFTKRRTWVALFLLSYGLLLSSSWNLLLSIRSWYYSARAARPSGSIGLLEVYASVLYGGVFGLLSVSAALAVAVPAAIVTWTAVLVLLAFCGKPRERLVMEAREVTGEIAGFALRVVIREGNFVAFCCAVAGFAALFWQKSPNA